MSVQRVICDLADIRFCFNELPSGAFKPSFQSFLSQDGTRAVTCFIDVTGATHQLCEMRLKSGWHFLQHEGQACLMGANSAGEVMWRLTGQHPFDRLRFEWHPTAFDELYGQVACGRFNVVAILALVLRLLPLGGLVLHGSAQVVDGNGIICTGPSGSGKSTLSALFHSSAVTVLTDEHPIIRPFGPESVTGFRVYGSPWPSSGGYVSNLSAPLKKIYFIEHGAENVITPLSTREAVLRLLDVSLVPWMDTSFFDPLIRTLETLIGVVPHAVLRFRPESTAVETVLRDLRSV